MMEDDMTFSEVEIYKARLETPGCHNVLHFNNAGAALMPQPVFDEMTDYLKLEMNIGAYEAHAQQRHRFDALYQNIAGMIGAQPQEIALAENATRAWDIAFYSIPFQPGDRILTGRAEYVSNFIAFLQIAEQKEVVIDIIPDDEHGQTSVEALSRMIDDRVKLIAITHVPTSGGLINPVEEIGKIARQAGIIYLLDACQAIGQLPLNVAEMGCDILSTTGRKFLRGPRGTGFLFVRQELIEKLQPVMLDLHAAEWTAEREYKIRPDARRFESWESNYAGFIGLSAAIKYYLDWGQERVAQRVQMLAASLREQLAAIPGVNIRDQGLNKSGIVTFDVEKVPADGLHPLLQERGINTSVTPLNFARLDLEPRNLSSLLRASVHYYNTEKEVERFCAVVESIAENPIPE